MKLRATLTLLALLGAGSVAVTGHAADKEFTTTLKDLHFTPDTLEVPAGERFKVLVKNEGTSSEEFESTDLKKEKVIPPGKTGSFVIGPLKAGEYKFFGDFHPDTAQGKLIAK